MKRTIRTRSGIFEFEQKSNNDLPVVEAWIDDRYIGEIGCFNMNAVSDLELIQMVSEYIEENY